MYDQALAPTFAPAATKAQERHRVMWKRLIREVQHASGYDELERLFELEADDDGLRQ